MPTFQVSLDGAPLKARVAASAAQAVNHAWFAEVAPIGSHGKDPAIKRRMRATMVSLHPTKSRVREPQPSRPGIVIKDVFPVEKPCPFCEDGMDDEGNACTECGGRGLVEVFQTE